MAYFKKHLKTIFLAVLATGVAVIWYAVLYVESHQDAIISFFDIGQGDSIFIVSPDGNQILIDGGPGNAVLAKLGGKMPFWDRSLDFVILTHPHADHVAGLLEVLKRYEVGQVLESGVLYGTPEYAEWRRLIKEKRIPVVVAHSGQEIRAGILRLTILSPRDGYASSSLKNVHDANVTIRLEYGSTSLLLMGDAERTVEYQILRGMPDALDADVLKVGHHGSKTSSSEAFLRAVSPDIAVIQVGRKNRYGHPHQAILERLAAVSAQVFRTDHDGDIELVTNGAHFIKMR